MAVDTIARGMAANAGSGGGGTGTTNYSDLTNKPKINNVELKGNKTLEDLGINIPDTDIKAVTFTTSQIVSMSPLKLNITEEQQKIFEDNNYVSFIIDATALGLPIGIVRRNAIFDDQITFIVDEPTFLSDTAKVESSNYLFGIYTIPEKTFLINSFETALKSDVLTKTNTTEFTPTEDYNPATKKYVDDNAASVAGVELTGEFSDGTLSVSLLNENGEQLSQASILVSGVAYNIASTQSYASTTFSFERDVLTQFGRIVNKNLDKEFVAYITDADDATFRFETHYETPSADSTGNTGTLYGIGVSAGYREKIKIFTTTYNIVNGEYVFTSIAFNNNTSKVALEQNVITRANTEAYTPSADYHPSTKLYTDKTHYENMTGYDATKTQVLKNINGTLTWVNEG